MADAPFRRARKVQLHAGTTVHIIQDWANEAIILAKAEELFTEGAIRVSLYLNNEYAGTYVKARYSNSPVFIGASVYEEVN